MKGDNFMNKIIKTLLLVMTLALVLVAFAACEQECVHQGGEATCVEKAVCELCGESYGSALGHKMEDKAGKDATCVEAGYTAHKECSACGLVEGKEEIAVLEHTFEDVEALNATCIEDGYTAHKKCTACDTEVGKEVVPAGHALSDVEALAATCTEDGYTAHKACANCEYTEGKEVVTMDHIDDDGNFLCDYNCGTVVEPQADSTLTLEQANALGLLVTTTQNKYYVTGAVKNIANTFNGNIYITNGTTTFYIYGTKSADGTVPFGSLETKPYAGDTVVMYGYISTQDGTAQMKDAWMTSCTHEHAYSEATCLKVATCVCGLTQGELADHDFKDGMCTVCNTVDPDFEGEVTVTVGRADFETAGAAAGSYATRTTTDGWVATNAALLSGGTTDANPKFIFIGAESTRAITLNGKVGGAGKLTSPTLSNGISKLSFKYGHAFSDKNGVDITINIIQNGVVVATYHLDNDTVTQKTAYDFVWTLEEEVKGDFTIEITNNSPSNSSSGNKDRVSIWDFEWVSN